VIDAEKVDRLWSTSTQVTKVQNVDVGRDHQGEGADQIRTELRNGTGILKTAKLCGVGTGTVQRIKREMAAG